MIRKGDLGLVASYMLTYENQQNPYVNRREAIFKFLSDYVTEFVSSERENEVRAMLPEVMATGVKRKDAVHLVCAILARCDYFITTDDRLLKYKTDKMELMNPIDFVRRLEGEQDE